MQPVPLTIGVTAHRDLKAEEIPRLKLLVGTFFDQLREDYPDNPLQVMSPLAEGGDRLVAEVAVERGLELVAILPFELAEYRRDFSSDASRAEFDALREKAHRVIELDPAGGFEVARIAEGGIARDVQYANLGACVSDRSQILVALWDGRQLNRPGGTSQVVNYHQFGHMRGVDGQFDRPNILAEDDTDLVVHLVCSRDRPDGDPPEPLIPLTQRLLISDPERREVAEFPPRYRHMLDRLAEYNRDLKLVPESVENPDYLPGWHRQLTEDSALLPIGEHFFSADYLAGYFQKRYVLALRTIAGLGLLMTSAFLAFADLEMSLMIYVFLGAFVFGAVVMNFASRFQWHRKYLDYRALAEGLRVQFYWGLGGVSGRFRNDFAHDNFLQKQDLEIGWIRNVMRHVSLVGDPVCRPAQLAQTIDHWVGDRETGQLGFYSSRSVRMHRSTQRTRRMIRVSLWLSLTAALALALLQFQMTEPMQQALLVIIGLLSIGVGVRELYASRTAEAELARQYEYMVRVFRDARLRLDQAENSEQKREILRALGEAALDEHAEWIKRHRERPLEQASF
ncbi:MAG: hypothetical protein AAGA23_17665 [Pseudomonadota bacterium]